MNVVHLYMCSFFVRNDSFSFKLTFLANIFPFLQGEFNFLFIQVAFPFLASDVLVIFFLQKFHSFSCKSFFLYLARFFLFLKYFFTFLSSVFFLGNVSFFFFKVFFFQAFFLFLQVLLLFSHVFPFLLCILSLLTSLKLFF